MALNLSVQEDKEKCYEGNDGHVVNNITSVSSHPVIRYFFCGQTENVAKPNKNNGQIRQKRKYRGVVLNGEQRILKMAQSKIKSREFAAKAHDRKRAREAHLKSLCEKLLEENHFLKKKIKFLEDYERRNVSPEPLRRTISAPTLLESEAKSVAFGS